MTKWNGDDVVTARLCKTRVARKHCTTEISVRYPYLLEITSEHPIEVLLYYYNNKEDRTSRKTTLHHSPMSYSKKKKSKWLTELRPGFFYRMVVNGKKKSIRGKMCNLKLINRKNSISVGIRLIANDKNVAKKRQCPSRKRSYVVSSSTLNDSSQQFESFLRKKIRLDPTIGLRIIICVASLFQMMIILLQIGLRIGKRSKENKFHPQNRQGILDEALCFAHTLFVHFFESENFQAAIARLLAVWDCTFCWYQNPQSKDPQSRYYASGDCFSLHCLFPINQCLRFLSSNKDQTCSFPLILLILKDGSLSAKSLSLIFWDQMVKILQL